jgi:enoyl-CoA hydratase
LLSLVGDVQVARSAMRTPGGECSLEAGLEYESAQFGLLFATEDMREGTGAFLQRRPPAFQNR